MGQRPEYDEDERPAEPGGVEFRPMRLEDIPGVLEVEHASFTVPWTMDAFRNELTQNHFAKYTVMLQGDRIIGYSGMWTVVDEAHITNIAVHPDFRGRSSESDCCGDGRSGDGLRHGGDDPRGSGVESYRPAVVCEVRLSGAGVRKGYYSDNKEDALIMWTDLKALAASSYQQAE